MAYPVYVSQVEWPFTGHLVYAATLLTTPQKWILNYDNLSPIDQAQLAKLVLANGGTLPLSSIDVAKNLILNTGKSWYDTYVGMTTFVPNESLPITPTYYGGLPITKFLTAAGDGTGQYNLVGDYHLAATDFTYLATGVYEINTVLITISDNSAFNQLDFGAGTALTNGFGLYIHLLGNPSPTPLLGGFKFKTNNDCLIMTGHATKTDFNGSSQTLVMSFNMMQDFGSALTLKPGDRFIVRLNDNLSTLISFTVGLRGTMHTIT